MRIVRTTALTCAHNVSTVRPLTKKRMSKNTNSATDGYAGSKKRTNLSIDPELVAIGKKYFGTTRYKSLSGFLDAKLAVEFRAMAPKLRKMKIKLPEHLFQK